MAGGRNGMGIYTSGERRYYDDAYNLLIQGRLLVSYDSVSEGKGGVDRSINQSFISVCTRDHLQLDEKKRSYNLQAAQPQKQVTTLYKISIFVFLHHHHQLSIGDGVT